MADSWARQNDLGGAPGRANTGDKIAEVRIGVAIGARIACQAGIVG